MAVTMFFRKQPGFCLGHNLIGNLGLKSRRSTTAFAKIEEVVDPPETMET